MMGMEEEAKYLVAITLLPLKWTIWSLPVRQMGLIRFIAYDAASNRPTPRVMLGNATPAHLMIGSLEADEVLSAIGRPSLQEGVQIFNPIS